MPVACGAVLLAGRVYRQWMAEWTSHSDETVHDHLLLKVSHARHNRSSSSDNILRLS